MEMWAFLAVFSAVLLGIYDILKKKSLNNNAVLPVLLISVFTCTLVYIPFIVGSKINPEFFRSINFFIPPLSKIDHIQIVGKSFLVLSSWILAFFAIKHLPLTIVTPIRATSPLWTLLGALIIFSEQLNSLQWIGLAITLMFFFMFSTTGSLEGIYFRKNKWIYLIIGATLLGASSGLYDKYIVREINRLSVQAWTGIYQLGIMIPVVLILWFPKRKKTTPFQWRWSIPLIGIFLIATDYFYFYALSDPESLVSVVSGIRRSGVAVSFVFAAIFFKEKNIKKKGVYLVGIIVGVLILAFASR